MTNHDLILAGVGFVEILLLLSLIVGFILFGFKNAGFGTWVPLAVWIFLGFVPLDFPLWEEKKAEQSNAALGLVLLVYAIKSFREDVINVRDKH